MIRLPITRLISSSRSPPSPSPSPPPPTHSHVPLSRPPAPLSPPRCFLQTEGRRNRGKEQDNSFRVRLPSKGEGGRQTDRQTVKRKKECSLGRSRIGGRFGGRRQSSSNGGRFSASVVAAETKHKTKTKGTDEKGVIVGERNRSRPSID